MAEIDDVSTANRTAVNDLIAAADRLGLVCTKPQASGSSPSRPTAQLIDGPQASAATLERTVKRLGIPASRSAFPFVRHD